MLFFCKKYSKNLFIYAYSFRVSWGVFLLHFLGISSTIVGMKQYFFIFGFFCILVVPFSGYADSVKIADGNTVNAEYEAKSAANNSEGSNDSIIGSNL